MCSFFVYFTQISIIGIPFEVAIGELASSNNSKTKKKNQISWKVPGKRTAKNRLVLFLNTKWQRHTHIHPSAQWYINGNYGIFHNWFAKGAFCRDGIQNANSERPKQRQNEVNKSNEMDIFMWLNHINKIQAEKSLHSRKFGFLGISVLWSECDLHITVRLVSSTLYRAGFCSGESVSQTFCVTSIVSSFYTWLKPHSSQFELFRLFFSSTVRNSPKKSISKLPQFSFRMY